MNLSLGGKNCIVTGASRGIGARVAWTLAQEGANVALVARDGTMLHELGKELEGRFGIRAHAVPGDLSTASGVESAMRAAIDRLDRIDILINGAGASSVGSFDLISDQDWQAALDLKLMGYVRCIRAVLSAMREKGSGRIVNIVGSGGRHATEGYVLGSINAALLHLTKSISDLVARDGITVVAVNPGPTATGRLLNALAVWAEQAHVDAELFTQKYVTTHIPLRRMASPDEIAKLVVIMASDAATFVTGSALDADGGAVRGMF